MKVSLALIFLIVSCATGPTRYVESGKSKQGYTDKIIDNNLRMTSFQGNSSTKKDQAQLYAKFRAIEICHEMNRTYTHILSIKDSTFDKEEVETIESPSYYYGVSPYYGRYGYGGWGGGMTVYGPVTTQTRSETYTYPQFDIYFECVEKALDARMSFSVLSSSQMKDFVKDLKGAVQVKEILPDSPNKNRFKVADIVTKANGTRVSTVVELYQAYKEAPDGKLQLEVIRDGVKKNISVKFTDVTRMVAEAQAEITKEACKLEGIKDVRKICKEKK